MSAIDDIRKQVVQHLLERHYGAKERGEDFFFTVEITDSNRVLYFPQSETGTKQLLRASFYANRQLSNLLISEQEQVFWEVEFDGRSAGEMQDAAYNLREYLSDFREGIRVIHRSLMLGRVEMLSQLVQPNSFLAEIDRFIDHIKPEIDRRIGDLKPNPRFSFLFLIRPEFDNYLESEPAYSPRSSIKKVNLTLKSIRIINFRGIHQTVIDNLPEKARWIVLTGENGFGKTSVLQAIAAGLYGNFDESGTLLVPETAFIGVEYYANGAVVENNSRALRQESADKKLNRELATYGSSRLQISASVTREMLDEQRPTTYHLFNSDGLLLSVEQLLKDSNGYNKPFFDQLVTLFKTLIPQLAEIRIELVNKLPEVLYVEQDEAGHVLTKGLSFSQLAAGFRSIIAMIGDLVYRLSIRQDVENLRDLQGIVLIDELELHLHPKYQKLLPEVLTTQFPNLQFIVSTHSPIPLLGIPKDAGVVLLHVSRSEETGIIVERLDVDFSVLTPNAILSSPIFGFKDLIPDSKADNQMIQPEDTYQAVLADQQLRQNIHQFLSPERQQELLNLINQQ